MYDFLFVLWSLIGKQENQCGNDNDQRLAFNSYDLLLFFFFKTASMDTGFHANCTLLLYMFESREAQLLMCTILSKGGFPVMFKKFVYLHPIGSKLNLRHKPNCIHEGRSSTGKLVTAQSCKNLIQLKYLFRFINLKVCKVFSFQYRYAIVDSYSRPVFLRLYRM